MSWKTKAACRGRGDIDWDGFGPVQVLVCSGCPVRAECLHEGLLEVESPGTWGMTSEAQRRRLTAGKTKVADIWQANVSAAHQYLVESAEGPTPTWSVR